MRKFGKHFWDNNTFATSDSDQHAHPHEHGRYKPSRRLYYMVEK